MINLVIGPSFKKDIDIAELHKTIERAFMVIQLDNNMLISLVITTDKKLKSLNREYRNMDETTDVLSFENNYLDLDSGQKYLGDIFISFSKAKEQAAAANHSVMDEIKLLTVHGFLHILGYDHATSAGKSKMWKIQEQILRHSQDEAGRLINER